MGELLEFILNQGEDFSRARLPSLYSDFTLQRHTNPDGYAANVTAWERALQKAAKAGLIPTPGDMHDTLSIMTGEDLLRSLETKEWGRPLALGRVIDEAINKRHMIPFQEFLDSPTSIYNPKWAPWLLSWCLQQLGFSKMASVNGSLRNARIVMLPNVEEAASKVISKMSFKSNLVDRIHPLEAFREEAARAINITDGLTDGDLNIIIIYLARDKGQITIKFKGPGEESLTISNHDRTIASLKSLIADVKQQITSITTKVDSLSMDAQEAVLVKNRMSALAALRSRKAAEATLAQRLDTLSQLEKVYDKIEQAVDQVTLVRVMEASTGVLRNLHADVNGVVGVENVMENLRHEMDKVDDIGNDIGNAIKVAGQGDAAIDESAIDNELEALVRQSQLENEEKDAICTRQKLATVEAPEDADGAAQILNKQENIKERRPAVLAPSSAGASAVDPLESISLDENQAPKIENSQAQTKIAESFPSGVAGV